MRSFCLLLLVSLGTSACAQVPRVSPPAPPAPGGHAEPEATPPARPRLPRQVRVTERTVYYDVQGASDREILASIRAASPIREAGVDGRPLDAFTRWRIDWRYRFARQGSVCRFTTVTVHVDLTTTLWRWTPPSNAPASLVSEWRRRARVLAEHEAGHASYTLVGARDIFSALRPMQAPTCDALRDAADAEGKRILDRVRAANRRYDEVTQHGTVSGR